MAVAVPELLDVLAREPESTVRHRIAHAVSSLILWQDVTRWIEPLARALRDPDLAVRGRIAWGLTHAGPSAAPLAGDLADCLLSGDESLHRHALEALAGIGPGAAAALPAVMDLVRSPSVGVRQLALRMGCASDGDRPPRLVEVLDVLEALSCDPTDSVRTEAMWRLAAIAAGLGPDRPERDRAMALLRAGRSDRASDVCVAAAQALRALEAARGDSGSGRPSSDHG